MLICSFPSINILSFFSWPPTTLQPKALLNRGAKVIIFAIKKNVDITISVQQLANHLKNLNVKTVIVIDKRFFFDEIIKALKLKESPIVDRVSLKNIFQI